MNTIIELVLFILAIQHLFKIVRVINTTFNHTQFVGAGGSGRKSLAQFASFIALQNETLQVDSRNWREELQKEELIKKNLNQWLKKIAIFQNNGEVSNLLSPEEKSNIIEEMRSHTSGTTK